MALILRQICLVARELEPAVTGLEHVLGLRRCFQDPEVEIFGLHNTLLPLGRNFLEIVAPIRPGTAAGRYLDRRGGDGGYMVILQAETRQDLLEARARALAAGIRIAAEHDRPHWYFCHLHPADMGAAFLDIEWDAKQEPNGHWMPAGGTGWEPCITQDTTVDFQAVELQSDDPETLAARWAHILNLPISPGPSIILPNATLRFTPPQDNRGPGLSTLEITVRDRAGITTRAGSATPELCGVRFRLVDLA